MPPPGGFDRPVGVVRCVIVDDNRSFLAAATALLEDEGLPVVGVASDADEALAAVPHLRPDVVLVDVTLGRESGFELARRLAAAEPPIPVIMISTYAEADLAELMQDAPVLGFVPKSRLSASEIRRLVSERPGR